MSPFGSSSGTSATFDEYDDFVPENLPEPGPFLDGHDVLDGERHVTFHRLTRDVFEERGVYDVTFGYNLAKLNLDRRHPDAGFRYAVDADDDGVLRAEFTPTTEFCPQGQVLVKGAFRAWNGLSDRHDYDLVRVRVDPMHQESESVNAEMADLEERFLDDGGVSGDDADGDPSGQPAPF